MNRETIYAALFALLKTVAGFNTYSRRVRMWTEVSPGEQPALMMSQVGEVAEFQSNTPTRWRLHVDVYLYVHTTNQDSAPAAALNPLLDAVVTALQPTDGTVKQTLGGLVQYCRISGPIETDEGRLGDQAVAMIPIEILTT